MPTYQVVDVKSVTGRADLDGNGLSYKSVHYRKSEWTRRAARYDLAQETNQPPSGRWRTAHTATHYVWFWGNP